MYETLRDTDILGVPDNELVGTTDAPFISSIYDPRNKTTIKMSWAALNFTLEPSLFILEWKLNFSA